jgi:hypothetical protein
MEAMHLVPAIILLYVGPDQTVPFASYLATVVGLLLVFWNKVVDVARWFVRRFKKNRPS